MSETSTSAKQWFVVHTYSGFENKVASAIESRAKIFNLQDSFGRVIVPNEKGREIRKSQQPETEGSGFRGHLGGAPARSAARGIDGRCRPRRRGSRESRPPLRG